MNRDEAVRRLAELVRRKDLTLAAERTYCAWVRRYSDFLKGLPLHLPSEHEPERFLTVLAQKDVAAGTQGRAFNALLPKCRSTPGRRPSGVLDPQFHPGRSSSSSEPPRSGALRAPGCGGAAFHQCHRWQIGRSLGSALWPSLTFSASSEAGVGRSRAKRRLNRYQSWGTAELACRFGAPAQNESQIKLRRAHSSVG